MDDLNKTPLLSPEDQLKQERDYQYFLKELGTAERKWEKFRKFSDRIVKRYRDEESFGKKYIYNINTNATNNQNEFPVKFNILFSNIQTILPHIIDKNPKPDFRRRYNDDDPTAREAADIMQRISEYENDCYNFQTVLQKCGLDMALVGMGSARVIFEQTEEDNTPQGYSMDNPGEAPDEFQQTEPQEQTQINQTEVATPQAQVSSLGFYQTIIKDQCARIVYVSWRDLIIPEAKSWQDVEWIAFKNFLTESAFKKQFPDSPMPELVYLDEEKDDKGKVGMPSYILVYEIWDKVTKRRIFMPSSGSTKQFLKEEDDPLHIEGFFPMPEPAWANQTNDTLIPIADYVFYDDQARELDRITQRLQQMVEACRTSGIYDKKYFELSQLFRTGDNKLYPIENYTDLSHQGGLKSIVDFIDITPYVNAIKVLYEQREQVKNVIYETLGIADILRGVSDPDETAKAQGIKAKFGGNRLSFKKYTMNRFVRDLFRIQAEIIAEHFVPEIMQKITGEQLTPEMYQLLIDDKMRSYRIEIESDETADMEAQADKQNRMEVVQTIANLLGTLLPLTQMGVPIAVIKELIVFTIKGFKYGRSFEDVLKNFDEIEGNMQQAQQQQAMQAQQMQAQQAQQQKENQQQLKAMDIQKEQEKSNVRMAELQQRAEADAQKNNIKQQELDLKKLKAAADLKLMHDQAMMLTQPLV